MRFVWPVCPPQRLYPKPTLFCLLCLRSPLFPFCSERKAKVQRHLLAIGAQKVFERNVTQETKLMQKTMFQIGLCLLIGGAENKNSPLLLVRFGMNYSRSACSVIRTYLKTPRVAFVTDSLCVRASLHVFCMCAFRLKRMSSNSSKALLTAVGTARIFTGQTCAQTRRRGGDQKRVLTGTRVRIADYYFSYFHCSHVYKCEKVLLAFRLLAMNDQNKHKFVQVISKFYSLR